MSSIIGQESRAVGITSAMSPVIDVSRDPRWGRTYETYGEDQYLISMMGIHYVRGMQQQGVSCIAKHFLGYAESQAGLNAATTRLNDRELYEVFATPFEAADKEAGLLAKKGGCDTEIPVGASYRNLPNYVRSGELDESLLDESVRRVLTIKFKRGLFENPYCEIEKLEEAMVNEEKESVSKKIAQDSFLKNQLLEIREVYYNSMKMKMFWIFNIIHI